MSRVYNFVAGTVEGTIAGGTLIWTKEMFNEEAKNGMLLATFSTVIPLGAGGGILAMAHQILQKVYDKVSKKVPREERPVSRNLGRAVGLAIPFAFAVAGTDFGKGLLYQLENSENRQDTTVPYIGPEEALKAAQAAEKLNVTIDTTNKKQPVATVKKPAQPKPAQPKSNKAKTLSL